MKVTWGSFREILTVLGSKTSMDLTTPKRERRWAVESSAAIASRETLTSSAVTGSPLWK